MQLNAKLTHAFLNLFKRCFKTELVRCGRALLKSTVVVDLHVVQVREGKPVAEG